MSRALLIAVLLLPVGACASAQAKAPVEQVSLEVPPVPPRVIDPAPIAPPSIPPVEDLAAPAPASPAPARPRPPRDASRSEAKPAETKPDVTEPEPVPAPPPAPVAPLRTGTSATGPEAEKQIRDLIARATKILETVDVRGMSEDRKAGFDTAKESINRAEEALKTSNLVLARTLADRAIRYAELLGGR